MNVAWPELLLGAATMFVLDPSVGTRRRAAMRAGTGRLARWAVGGFGRQLLRTPTLWKRRERVRPLSDIELEDLVRDTLAATDAPESVRVDVRTRRVTLSGPILARDVVGLLRRVAEVPGVVAVRNRLQVRRASRDTEPPSDSQRARAS